MNDSDDFTKFIFEKEAEYLLHLLTIPIEGQQPQVRMATAIPDTLPTPTSNNAPPQNVGRNISTIQKSISAISGAFMTSLLVTPLDVVRVRLQSQQPTPSATAAPLPAGVSPRLGYSTLGAGNGNSAVTACCREVFFSRGWSVSGTTMQCDYIPYESAAIEGGVCAAEETTKRSFQGTWEGLRKIARYEGVTSLWRGLSPTLAMAVPANVIYFVGYDTLRTSLPSSIPQTLAPLIAGMSARTLAVAAISPLELFRTRLQAYHPTENRSSFRSVLNGINSLVREQGIRSLWRGLELTLWRDVPFSGIYWTGYEYLRHKFKQHEVFRRGGESGFFEEAFTAGWLSGTFAAFVTQPFDVSKTRRQEYTTVTQGSEVSSTLKLMGMIRRDEGVRGLWKGFVPRMLKVAPACAIMISSYELGKVFFERQQKK